MFDIGAKKYLIEQQSGRILNIFHKDNAGICISSLNKKNEWTAPVVVKMDVMQDFSVCPGSQDNIHILCQHKDGDLMHLFFDNQTWKINPVLKGRHPSAYNKHPCIICAGERVLFFYVVKHAGKALLSYQVYDKAKDSLSGPEAIDYIEEARIPYMVSKGPKDELYIVYCRNGDGKKSIGYKPYLSSSDEWGDFHTYTLYEGKGKMISSACDSNSNLHICWQRLVSPKYELVYSMVKVQNGIWGDEKVLTSSLYPFSNASLAILEDRVIIYWLKGSSIYSCISYDSGSTWSKPELYNFNDNSPLHCIAHYTHPMENTGTGSYNILPGSFSEGFRLAFVNAPEGKSSGGSNHRFSSSDSQTSQQQNIKELCHQVKELEKMVESLSAKQREIGVELEKINVKNGIIDSVISKLKTRMEEQEKTRLNKEHEESKPAVCLKKAQENIKAPIMPGAGFSGITAEYLRRLKQQ